MRVAIAVLLVLVLALPSAAAAQRFERASGSGKVTIPPGTDAFAAHAAFSAHHDPETGSVGGYFVGRGALAGMPFAQQGKVTCLRVEGNRAALRYRFERASGGTAPFEGGGIQVFVEDNGPHGDGATFDAPEPAGVFDLHAGVCDDPNTRVYQRIDSGNFVVRDAAP